MGCLMDEIQNGGGCDGGSLEDIVREAVQEVIADGVVCRDQ
jgi:hypothetical protein